MSNPFLTLINEALEGAEGGCLPMQIRLKGELSPGPLQGVVSKHPTIGELLTVATSVQMKNASGETVLVGTMDLHIAASDITWVCLQGSPTPVEEKPDFSM